MSFVLDASVACAWLFPDETAPALEDLLDQAAVEEVFVPGLWRSEVMNVLVQASRRDRISPDAIVEIWALLDRLQIRESAYRAPVDQIVGLCQKYGLTAYDAHYLALALWLRLPLATLDGPLAAAAVREGLKVLS